MSALNAASNTYGLLADLVLLAHVLFVLFMALGLVVIWIGGLCRWKFVHNSRFRVAHLIGMGLVLAETWLGMACPLTTLETRLRLLAGEASPYQTTFLEHWLGRLLFCDFSPTTFTVLYTSFFGMILATLWLVPIRRPKAPTGPTAE